MLLTITRHGELATDLGYLLHKHPDRVHTREFSFGKAHAFYPVANETECTVALLLEIDTVAIIRGRRQAELALQHYVNDRPYVTSSFMSVALGRMFSTALGGRCEQRPGLAEEALPLTAELPVAPCRGGEGFLRRLFEPLGYTVDITVHTQDEAFLKRPLAPYYGLRLRGRVRLAELLTHLYVLIPVLDDEKHYWVGEDEVEKLMRRGEGWLEAHPEKETIVSRYLKRRGALVNRALTALREVEVDDAEQPGEDPEAAGEAPLRLHDLRLETVRDALKATGASTVADLGCGEGKLLRLLLKEPQFTGLFGMDVSPSVLEKAAKRLRLDEMPPTQRAKLSLAQGSLLYRDARLKGLDAAALVEVIEHLEPSRLRAMERNVFEFAKPRAVLVTTPNRDYNALFPTLPEGGMRHPDHRFEWSRAEFEAWAQGVAARNGYTVRFSPVGPVDPALGAPTQMGVFTWS